MTAAISEADIKQLFEKMRLAAVEEDTATQLQLFDVAKARGCDFAFSTSDSVKFIRDGGFPDGYPNTEVDCRVTLTLGGVVVASWTETYVGYYGSMGTGWWVEEGESTPLSPGICDLMDTLKLEPPIPVVPEPPHDLDSDEEGSIEPSTR